MIVAGLKMIDGWPRRASLEHQSAAEKAIQAAVDEVEKLGADARLTGAIMFLDKARHLVGDVVDDRG